MSDGRLLDLLDDTVADVLSATDLDQVLDAITHRLKSHVGVWATWIAVLMPDVTVKVIAASTQMKSFFDVGSVISVALTERTMQVFALTASGRVVMHSPNERAMGLIDDTLASEGVKYLVVLPLLDDGALAGAIAIGSFGDEMVTSAQIPFFEGLARGVDAHVIGLIRASGVADGSVL